MVILVVFHNLRSYDSHLLRYVTPAAMTRPPRVRAPLVRCCMGPKYNMG